MDALRHRKDTARSDDSSRGAEGVTSRDLEDICRRLELEFAEMQGKQLLITGGAGFLGYYLIQSVLHWNQSRGTTPIQLTSCDNYIRGVPAWLADVAGDPTLTLLKHDITVPLPDSAGAFDFVIHAASIASPTYYRKHPIETMDANVNGLRLLLDRLRGLSRRVSGYRFSLSVDQRNLRRSTS